MIYDDIRSHFGENKRLLQFSTLDSEDKTKFMSEWISPQFLPFQKYLGKSTRYLFIGDYGFTYDYFSKDDWRSNNGDVTISTPIKLDKPIWRDKIKYAMFAIDFVGSKNDLKAIDLNIAPGTVGLELGLSGFQMVDSIKRWLDKHGQ